MFNKEFTDKVSVYEDMHIVIDGKKEKQRYEKDIVLSMTTEIAKELIRTLERRITQCDIVCVNLATGSNLKGNPILGETCSQVPQE